MFFNIILFQLNSATGGSLNLETPQGAVASTIFALIIGYGLARCQQKFINNCFKKVKIFFSEVDQQLLMS